MTLCENVDQCSQPLKNCLHIICMICGLDHNLLDNRPICRVARTELSGSTVEHKTKKMT